MPQTVESNIQFSSDQENGKLPKFYIAIITKPMLFLTRQLTDYMYNDTFTEPGYK